MIAFERYNIDPVKEKITIINAGTDPARFSALTTRALDASIINAGFAPRLTALGFNVDCPAERVRCPLHAGQPGYHPTSYPKPKRPNPTPGP